VGNRTDYTGKPSSFLALNMIRMGTAEIYFYTQPEVSMNGDVPEMRIRFIINVPTPVYAISFNTLLFCAYEDDCLRPHNPVIVAGLINGYLGGSIVSRALNSIRSTNISTALTQFMSSPPQYVALGFHRLYFRTGVSLKLGYVDTKVISLNFTVNVSQWVWHGYANYLLSNWGNIRFFKINF
jgi:hypothetical protein